MNEREKRFCEEYLIDLCATRAARRAGYAPKTANRNAANWINPKHPSKPELREEIDRMLAVRAQRTQVSADRVVRELAEIAFEGGTPEPEPVARESEDAGPAVEDGAREVPEPERADAPPKRGAARRKAGDGVRTQDRLRALELLGKHLGVFTAGEARAEPEQPVILVEEEGKGEDGDA